MLVIVISSKSNNKIKDTAKLFCSSKKRSQDGLFVVEGLRLCTDALLSDVRIKTVFVTEDCHKKHKAEIDALLAKSDEGFYVTQEVLKSITDTINPQGVVCVCEIQSKDFLITENLNAVVLMNVADPSNLGAISRTAEAFGISLMIVSGGCDIYNPKALRASMGALFRLPVIQMNPEKVLEYCKENNIKTFASTPRKSAINIKSADFSARNAMIIGNEANGLDDFVLNNCDQQVTIPMIGRAESLNAATAASVLMYEMVRKDI